ncbi:MAG TPA: chemotaxis protein CheX, partial [Polyangiaceae bacterium]
GTPEIPMQMGLFADERGCQRLAKALLGMDENDEDLPAADLGDAVSEVLNMLAGSVKRRISDHADVKLGLPVFVRGAVFSTHYSMLTARLSLGPVHAVVVFALPEANATLR